MRLCSCGNRSPLPAARRARRLGALPLAALLCGLLGCSGNAQLEMAALDFQMIDPPAPRVTRVDLDRCFWWTDDDGFVWISIERAMRPFFGAFGEVLLQFSFSLDRPPAGKARNYIVSDRELRGLVRLGPAESRFVSVNGIVAAYREPGQRLRGSFRLEATRQTSRVLGGWGLPARFLLMGSFNAIHDAARGRAVAAATEESGWERDPRPVPRGAKPRATTRPAASQPATAAAKP